ncbi:choline/carnitine O-acetyltransferase [Planoprotostelium fungivorum]|uniref:Choline/carnitine O-acetyltransferase n=1 Tax=Planoprotostelium fungivorum TaxID=1890364 RepID=A0A2P6NLS0_9EUKA|nr:choline/carnitine O-acetyltransferase [Planoprotostelium fungivorum]
MEYFRARSPPRSPPNATPTHEESEKDSPPSNSNGKINVLINRTRDSLRYWENQTVSLLKAYVPEKVAQRLEVRSVFGWTDVSSKEEELEDGDDQPKWRTFERQDSLPRLPVPDLRSTMTKYLKTVRPLLTDDEYKTTQEHVREFLENGDGERLQKLLMERDSAEPQHTSWLEGWWDDAYLFGRDSITINVNYFFVFEDEPHLQREVKCVQSHRAARLLRGALVFKKKLDEEKLEPDMERSTPLDMSQYPRVFCASRIPGKDRDHIITYTTYRPQGRSQNSKTTEYVEASPGHVIVIFRNQFYSLHVMEKGKIASAAEIEAGFEEIKRQILLVGDVCPPVGVLTAWNRTRWYHTREKMIQLDPANEESALMVVCLDDSAPTSHDETSRVMLHGPATNRWFDKHNLIVCANGNAGMVFEHSVGDGTSTLRLADEMYKYSRKADPKSPKTFRRAHEERLSFVLNEDIEDDIEAAFNHLRESILRNETSTLIFERYGGQLMKDNNMSPDAFAQLAIQLTYHRIFGRPGATYEAASTKKFLHGRTETVRSVSAESVAFCRAAEQPLHLSLDCGLPKQLSLLKDACVAHTNYMREAKEGRGVDRHLFGLQILADDLCNKNEMQRPGLFLDPAYKRSSHWVVSTSHCGSPSLSLFGFGPVVLDGFGVGYMIKNNSMSFNITCKETSGASSALFASMLESSLLYLQSVALAHPDKLKSPSASLHFTHPTSSTEFHYVKQLQHYR